MVHFWLTPKCLDYQLNWPVWITSSSTEDRDATSSLMPLKLTSCEKKLWSECYETGIPPYDSLGHIAEVILHYRQVGETEDPVIPSSDYENIVDWSPTRVCNATYPCRAVNCPFENFHSSYYINCTNVNDLKLLEATASDTLPNADPDSDCPECTFFVNFNFEGDSDTSAINGRNFLLPAHPPQTQNLQFEANDIIIM